MHSVRLADLRAWGLVLSMALPGFASSSALAKETGDVRTYLISIERLFASLEFEHALHQIHLARQLPHDTDEDVVLSLYEGIILAEQGNMEQCTGSFQAALLLRPDAKLPVLVSPKVAQHFEAVRKKTKAELQAASAKLEAERREPRAGTLSSGDTPVAAPPPAAPLTATAQKVSGTATHGSRGLRRYSWIPAIAGGALVAAGGASWAMSRSELSRLNGDDPALSTRADVQRSVSRGRTWQTVGISLLGVGAAGVAAAVAMYGLEGTEEYVVLGVGTDGTAAFVAGRWP
jgi:hypothetical protein